MMQLLLRACSGAVVGHGAGGGSQGDQPDCAGVGHIQSRAHLGAQGHGLPGVVVQFGNDGAVTLQRIVAHQIVAHQGATAGAGIDG